MHNVQSPGSALVLSACAAQHPGDRAEQQDRVAVLRSRRAPRSALGLLADGLGGRSGGSLAAEQALVVAQRLFDDFADGGPVERFFEDLVAEIQVVVQLSGVTTGLEPHTTLAAVLLQPSRVDWCHVGDSRVYHFRGARLATRTLDDTFGEQLIAEGRLPVDRARSHPSAGLLTQALGGDRRPHPTVAGVRDPQDIDRFLLCSDGLWSQVTDTELGEIIDRHPPREAAELLVDLARHRAGGRGDNCSMVIFKMAAAAA
jgi:PPM family protein phosphatase